MTFVTLQENIERETVIKKSRFICALRIAETRDEAIEQLTGIKKKHYDASHNCSAMVIGRAREFEKASDDGEPSGTAGAPMLEVLRKKGVTNILAVVTRYFGGTLLGAGGLVRAYSGGVADALKEARFLENIPADIVELGIDYADYGKLCQVAAEFDIPVEGDFLEKVKARVVIDKRQTAAFGERLTQAFMGADVFRVSGETLLQRKI